MQDAKDFWAHSENIPADWPTGPDGRPEPAAALAVQWELGSMADITLSFLAGCGIPAFKAGTQGKVILGFAGLGVDIFVPESRLEEARALLAAGIPADDGAKAP